MGGVSSGRRGEEEGKRKESHHLVTKVLHFGEPARGHTHKHFFWQQVTLGIQWTFWEDLFLGQSTRYQVFLWIIVFFSGRGGGGRAGGGWKLGGGGGGGGEGGDTQLDGRTDGRMDSMAG